MLKHAPPVTIEKSSNHISTADRQTKKHLVNYSKIPLANVVRLVAERYETQSNVKLDGFRSRLRASCVSSHTEEF